MIFFKGYFTRNYGRDLNTIGPRIFLLLEISSGISPEIPPVVSWEMPAVFHLEMFQEISNDFFQEFSKDFTRGSLWFFQSEIFGEVSGRFGEEYLR